MALERIPEHGQREVRALLRGRLDLAAAAGAAVAMVQPHALASLWAPE